MKLIDLLIQELPKRGGWPDGVNRINQAYDGRLEDYRKDGDSYSLKINEVLPLTCNHRGEAEYVHESGADFVTREQYEAALAAAQQPVWNGEGFPPVGCECEIKRIADWMPVTIKFISDRHTVFTTFGGTEDCYQTCSLQFRPIRSEAERKREEAIDEITKAMGVFAVKEVGKDIYNAIAAGKIPHIQLK